MTETELNDAIIRHALELQRLSAGEEARAMAIMAEMEADLRRLLAVGELSDEGKRRIAAVLRDADAIINRGYQGIATQVDTNALVLLVADNTVAAMRNTMPNVVAPSPERLASLADAILIDGAPASAWWQRQSADTAWRFAREVRQGVVEGATNEQITSRIFGQGDEPGFMGTSRRNVRGLVHSSVMTAANQARLDTYRKNSRHVAGVRWLSTLDSHTCITCMALDGSEWDLEGNKRGDTTLDFQVPPAHFACRCIASPIAKSLNSILGTTGFDEAIASGRRRASSEGPVSDRTFGEFLARQSPEYIEDALGRGRAEMWRAGQITLTDLVSGSGRPLTLTQLRGR